MTRAFEAVDADAVDAQALRLDPVPHRRALVQHLMPWSWNIGRCGAGFDPAVSTIFTPSSTITCRYSSYGGGLIDGRIVRFTPNGLSVSSRVLAISRARSAGVGCVSAVMKPKPPALATAATSSARPTHCMPPWAMGCSTPKTSVNFVVIVIEEPSGSRRPDGSPRR